MKLEGFIGPAYTLDSVQVDAQRCVNLYPEVIESGKGKEGQVAYLKSTPGLEKIWEIGLGPIRCIHIDSIGRIFVVSGGKIFLVTPRADWIVRFRPTEYEEKTLAQDSDINTSTNTMTITDHGYDTGVKVHVLSSTGMPLGTSVLTDYWVISTGAHTFKLANSLANAVAGTELNISSTGTGTLTVTPQIPDPHLSLPYSDAVNVAEDGFIKNGHQFYTGLKLRFSTNGVYPGSFSPSTDYFVVKTDDNKFQLASSLANASAGTELTLTAVSDSVEWSILEMSTAGFEGVEVLAVATSSGVMNAASMSDLGEARDSSTVFVDGSSNYLFREEVDKESFESLGDVRVAEAVFDFPDQVILYTLEDPDSFIGTTIRIQTGTSGADGLDYRISTIFHDGAPRITIHEGAGANTCTGAMFVEFINTRAIAGFTTRIDDDLGILDNMRASGGGGDAIRPDILSKGSPYGVQFTEQLYSGVGFGSVPKATHITWIDGYFIVNEGGTNKFYVSDLKNFNINTLSFTSAEGTPDTIVALISNHRDLWVFGERSIEVYTNTGNADFPFERISGGFLEVGCGAGYSVAKIDGTILWLGRSEHGEGQVFAARGMTPQRVSTHAIEQAIASYADPSGAVAYTYESKGHKFYVLSFAEATWVFDLSTGLWHERAFTNNGVLERHRGFTCAYSAKAKAHLVGDYATNKVYVMRDDYYMDDTTAITRLRSSPHVSSGLDRVFCPKFQLDMQTGVGLDGSGQGSDPQAMLDWSDDGGHTWSSEVWSSLGKTIGGIGEFTKRVIWRRLGSFRDRIFRVKITDPVKVNIISADIDVEKGSN